MKFRILAILALSALGAAAQEAAKGQPVTQGDLRRVIERDGVFVPAEAAEIALELKQYRGDLRLLEVRAHGSFVNEGDVVARLDPEAVDRQIEDAGLALERARMALRHAEEGARLQAVEQAEALARAEREAMRAEIRLRGYREFEKPMDDESERLSVQNRTHRIEDQRDELEQLEKMYSEDELVDATEEIVLKRSRRGLAQAEAGFDLDERRRKYQDEFYDAWREEDLVANLAKQQRELEGVRVRNAMAAERTEADLAKQRRDFARQEADFAELKADKEAFLVRAPRAGLLLHGEADGAPWENHHEAGGTVRNRQVFLTVASPKKLGLRLSVEEKTFSEVSEGMAVEVAPVALEDVTVVGSLQVDYLPGKNGQFDARVVLETTPVGVRPGMHAKANLIVAQARGAVLVPAGAVKQDEDGRSYVMFSSSESGPFEKRTVVVGLSDGKQTEIKDGLTAGGFVQP